MTNPSLQLIQYDWLLMGFRGGRDERLAVIDLCRRSNGTVLFREGDVMVVEISAFPSVVEDLLDKLPRARVTHLWRSGTRAPMRRCSSQRPDFRQPRPGSSSVDRPSAGSFDRDPRQCGVSLR